VAPETASTKPSLPENIKEDVKKASSGIATKVLWWVVGIFGVLGSILGIVALLKRKGPLTAAKEVIKKSKSELVKADIEAKKKMAEAKGAEKTVLDELDRIKKIKDPDEALDELEDLYNRKPADETKNKV
jgi:F420-0:gamma-glutamyl ligase-like protein